MGIRGMKPIDYVIQAQHNEKSEMEGIGSDGGKMLRIVGVGFIPCFQAIL